MSKRIEESKPKLFRSWSYLWLPS